MKVNKLAFTLIELLVVIAIIGILSTLAVVSLTNARQSARDAKRVADIKQIQTALELYYQDNGEYPATITDNSIATSGIVYMQTYPTAPTPADGDCTDEYNTYTYTVSGTENSSYSLTFCLGNKTNDLSAGSKEAIPGGIIVFIPPTPWACGDTLVDSRDSNEYSTVLIGTQCWMKENLAYLPIVHNNSESLSQGSNSLPSYGVYGYNGSDVPTAKATYNYSTYGVLYNWYAVSQASICPTNWHVSSHAEWTTLATYLGGKSIAGGKMKETGTTHWTSPNTGADNSSVFTALPAGERFTNGTFNVLRNNAYFWSSSAYYDTDYSWLWILKYNNIEAGNGMTDRDCGCSIRCIKD